MGSGVLLDPDAATGPPTGSRRSHPGPEQGSRQRTRWGGSGGSCPGLPPECNQGSLAVPVGVRAAPSAFARRRPARTLQRVRRLVASGSVAASPSWRAIPRRSLSAGAMTKGTRQPPDGAERKVVTVLFADVDETVPQFGERDPEDVGRMLAGHLERARAEIESYGGTVEQVVGGTTIAVFGVPRTREDDPERAVRAALAIRDALLGERARAGPGARRPGWGVPEVRLRVAITTGKALVRTGPARRGPVTAPVRPQPAGGPARRDPRLRRHRAAHPPRHRLRRRQPARAREPRRAGGGLAGDRDRKSTRLTPVTSLSRMPSSA